MAVSKTGLRRRNRAEMGSRPTYFGPSRPQVVVSDLNVYDAALERIRWVFEEFDGKVVVGNSGGKDSTVVLELAAMVAAERGELPLDVYWLDQEAEFEATVEYQRYLMYDRQDIRFHWYQIPFQLFNSTNLENPWLNVWDEATPERWLREKEPSSIHVNDTGRTRFTKVMDGIITKHFNGWAVLTGVRAEESPARNMSSRARPVYKWVTWAVRAQQKVPKERNPNINGFRFQPIYDWSYRDVWKAIDMNGWRYNTHYDHLHQYGVPTKNMRVSNYHHETALRSLHFLQEVEPETWEKATQRLQGINAYGHLRSDQYPKSLPYMFASWEEYMHHLIDNLAPERDRAVYRRQYAELRKGVEALGYDLAEHPELVDKLAGVVGRSVIGGDLYGTKVKNWLIELPKDQMRLEAREESIRRAARRPAPTAPDRESRVPA